MRGNVSPETQEVIVLTWLIGALHYNATNALQYQEKLRTAADEARQPIAATNVVIFSAYENEHVPARHNRIVFGPQYKAPVAEGISRLTVRIPAEVDDYDFEDLDKKSWWNDVFIEVFDSDGISQDYLLNSKGLTPFSSAETDIAPDLNFGETGDLYMVVAEATEAPRVSVSVRTLNKLVGSGHSQYVYQIQSNDDEPPILM